MPRAPRIPRRLPLAAGDLAMLRGRHVHDAVIRAIVTLDGHVDLERLRRALRLSLDAVPVAGCRLVEGHGRSHYERLLALDDAPLLEVQTVAAASEADQALARFALTPLDPQQGPLLRAAVLRGERDLFCLRLHHLVGDGVGTLDYLYLLADIYAALERDPGYRPRPQASRHRGYGQLIRRLSCRELRQALATPPGPFLRTNTWSLKLPPVEPEGASGPPLLIARELAPAQLAGICAYARARQATVNDVLLAAWYRAIHRLAQPAPGVQLGVATHLNLRRRLPNGQARAVANLSQMALTCIGDELGVTLADTVARVRADMERVKQATPSLGMLWPELVMPHAWAERLLRRRMRRLRPGGPPRRLMGPGAPLFNNIGRVDPARLRLGAPVLNAYLTACVPAEGGRGMQAVVTTCGERLNIAVVLRDIGQDRQALDALLDAFAQELSATWR